MRFDTITKHTGALVLGVSAIIALGTLTACSSGSTPSPAVGAPSSAVAAMPAEANFIADMPTASGSAMTTMAIAVEGEKVVAYATNGTNDEAYFFGTQKDGQLDLTSMYADQMTASFDGSHITGELVMNEDGAKPQEFAASRVEAPAGIFTATHDTSRATWIVRPDRTMVGVMDNSAPGDHKVPDAIAAQDQQFKDKVRQRRLDRQMQPAPTMTLSNRTMEMNGTAVTAVPVTGGMTF